MSVAAREPHFTEDAEGQDGWKAPFWQAPVRQGELALHPDGPLRYARREAYLQKRAGKSRLRWNVRYFELKDGHLRWWRPAFREQLLQPTAPKVTLREPRPEPVRCLDLSRLKGVLRTKVKFPYSTRILLRFDEAYTDYQLELRAEKELVILEWYKLFSRFTMEVMEVEHERETEDGNDVCLGGGMTSDAEDTADEAAAAQPGGS
mmetsp:Transcript_86288/g.217175  ORF Transcript_86288/g.217175 Transcript_86288/m.217175 type:complete len:205 (+) Transcript_86288:128-742(+)